MLKFFIFLFLNINIANSATFISTHRDWNLFTTKTKEKNVEKDFCYIASLPIEKKGTYKKRGEPYVIITREKGTQNDEVSLSSGFLFDEDKDVEVSILKRKFPLFTNEEKAWTYDKNDDLEIIKQMKLGAKMYVIGYSKYGTNANDTYSLIGFNDAYQKMTNICK